MRASLKSRKGFSTIVTIFSILLLTLTFMAKEKTGETESKFSSIQTELLLKSFLRAQAPGNPQDLTPEVGEVITNADLVSWTCNNNKNSRNSKALKDSLNNYFDTVYEDDWHLEITYSDTRLDKKGFGHKSWLKEVEYEIETYATAAYLAAMWGKSGIFTKNDVPKELALKLFLIPYRDAGYASQIIPCTDNNALAIVTLKSHTAFFEIKHLRMMGIK